MASEGIRGSRRASSEWYSAGIPAKILRLKTRPLDLPLTLSASAFFVSGV